jgi:hypothetical protein
MTRDTFREIFRSEPRDIGAGVTSTGWNPNWDALRLPAIKRHWEDEGFGPRLVAVTFYGERNLYRWKEEGYSLGGKCKIEGKEVSGYTSNIMVEVEGSLFQVAVISIRSDS